MLASLQSFRPRGEQAPAPHPVRFQAQGRARLVLGGQSFRLRLEAGRVRWDEVDLDAERAAAILTGIPSPLVELDDCLRELEAEGADVRRLLEEMTRPRSQQEVEQSQNPLTLQLAASSSTTGWRRAVAENRGAALCTLRRLSQDPKPEVSAAAVGNPRLARLLGWQWLQHAGVAARTRFAEAATLDERLLERLLADLPAVKAALARNPGVPEAVLERLARERDSIVRASAGANPRLPRRTLSRLVGSLDPIVRAAVAGNPALDASEIARLAADSEFSVVVATLQNPSRDDRAPVQAARSPELYLRRIAARDPLLPPASLERLAQDPGPEVRAVVALRPGLEPECWELLAKDRDRQVARSLARNPKLPGRLLPVLLSRRHWEIRAVIGNRADCPRELLWQLAQDRRREVRRAVLGNRSVTLEILLRLAEDEDIELATTASHLIAEMAGEPLPFEERLEVEAIRDEHGILVSEE